MKKKIVASILGMVMAISVTACGNSNEKTYTQSEVDAMMEAAAEGKEVNSESAEELSEDVAEDIEEDDEEIIENKPVSGEFYTKYEAFTMFASEAQIEETVLLDEKDVKITAKEITYGYSPEVIIEFENNSDKELEFITGSLGYSCNSVNGYMSSGYINETIAAGKKAKAKMSLSEDELMLLGIRDIGELEIGFMIQDTDYKEYISMDPVKVKTTGGYDYSDESFLEAVRNQYVAEELGYSVAQIVDDVLYDANDIKVNSAVVAENDGEGVLMLEIENLASDMQVAGVADIMVNGVVVSSGTWDSERINTGKKAILSVRLENVVEEEYRDILGLAEIGEISVNIEVKNREYDNIAEPERITVTIPNRETECSCKGEEVYNSNGIIITSLGKMDDSSAYSGKVHMLFLIENTGKEPISFDTDYDGNSVNGFMVDISAYSMNIQPGEVAFFDAYLYDHDKEDCGIESAADIEEIDMAFEVRDHNYHTIVEDSVSVKY